MTSAPQPKVGIRNKLWAWGDSPFTGLGVGVIIGGVGALVSLKFLFILGGIFIAIAFIRASFFGCLKTSWLRNGLQVVSCLVLGAALFFIWRVTPKPKEPPSAEENAAAIVALEKKEGLIAVPPAPVSSQPSPPLNPSPKKTLPQKKPKAEIPPIAHPPIRPAPIEPTPPQVARFSITQNPDVSAKADAPYKIRVVVQTNMEFSQLKLAIQCDGPIADAQMGNIGEFYGGQGIVKGHPNVYVLNYPSVVPPYGPTNPIIVYMWSVNPLTCNKVSTF